MIMNRRYVIYSLLILQLTILIVFFWKFDQYFAQDSENQGNRKQNHDEILDTRYNSLIFGDNITGFSEFIVPNIVHNILFGYNEITFSHFISLLSVIKTQKPDFIYIHCDCYYLTGYYYHIFIEKLKTTNTSLIIRKIEQPRYIFGIRIHDDFLNWHSSDFTRLNVLAKFGGIYLDNDIYIIKSLDKFRKFEMTLNRDPIDYISNGVLIAHRNARFIKLWIDSYRDYNPWYWYYNAGALPTLAILEKQPHLAHRLSGEFAVYGPRVCPMLYKTYEEKWRTDYYLIHLFMRGNQIALPNWCFNNSLPEEMYYNETIVENMNNTFSDMCKQLGFNELFSTKTL